MRPTLLPGLRRLWRDRHAVQLGTDPRRAVVLEFADPRLARVLDLLDGSRTEQAVLRDAATLGITEPAAVALLSTLRDGGLAVDAHTLVPPGLPEPVRRGLTTEIAALALGREVAPAVAIRRRAAAHVLVTGYGRLAVPIAAALAQAGVGHVDTAVSGRTRPSDAAPGGLSPADAGRLPLPQLPRPAPPGTRPGLAGPGRPAVHRPGGHRTDRGDDGTGRDRVRRRRGPRLPRRPQAADHRHHDRADRPRSRDPARMVTAPGL